MKRSRNSSRHAAVLVYQAVKRLDGLGIAQHAGNGPPVSRIGGLALCAGLGLHGLGVALGALGQAINQPLSNFHNFAAVVVGKLLVASGLELNVVACMSESEPRGAFSVLGVLFGKGHFVSPKRGNPADESSSHVTSDNATTVRREILA